MNKKIQKNIKILSRFNFFSDFNLYAPIAILYFSRVTGSFTLGMSIFSVVMISSALFEIPTGIFSDMIGRKKTMILGASAAVIYMILYAIGGSYIVLFIGAIFNGLSRSFYSGNDDALLYDTLVQMGKKERYHSVLGKVSSMFQLALGIAALIGGFIANWSFTAVLWASVVPQVICLILAFHFIEPKLHTAKSTNIYTHLLDSIKQFAINKKLRLLSVASVVSYGVGEASYQFRSVFVATLWPVWAIGIVHSSTNLGAAASFWYSGKIIDRFKSLQILIGAKLYSFTVNLIALIFPTLLSPVLLASHSLFYGVTEVAKNSLMQKEFTEKQRATMGSLNSLFGSLFFGFFAIILGLIADSVGPAKALIFAQLVSSTMVYIYWRLFKNDKDVILQSDIIK